MKKNQAIAYIRQLCCLGLEPEAAMAEVIRSVKWVIPSEANMFGGLNAQIPSYVAYTIPEYYLRDALENLLELVQVPPESNECMPLMQWQLTHGVLDDPRIAMPNYYSSDLFNLVVRPYGQHHVLQAMLASEGEPVGSIALFRPRTQPAFQAGDKRQLEALLPYLKHALRPRMDTETDFAGGGEGGMFVADSQGKLLFASEAARQLLSLVCHPVHAVGPRHRDNDADLPPAVARLCRNLAGIFRGQEAPPPTLTHTNTRGRFLFRAYWLDATSREPDGLIGVTVEHQEPMALRLMRGMQHLPLSPTQMQVCLLLAQGLTHQDIARRLHVKLYTAQDHIRKIYAKLGIHRREELAERIQAQSAETRSFRPHRTADAGPETTQTHRPCRAP